MPDGTTFEVEPRVFAEIGGDHASDGGGIHPDIEVEVEPGTTALWTEPVFTAAGGKVYRRGRLVEHPTPLLAALLNDPHAGSYPLGRELAAAMGEAKRQRGRK